VGKKSSVMQKPFLKICGGPEPSTSASTNCGHPFTLGMARNPPSPTSFLCSHLMSWMSHKTGRSTMNQSPRMLPFLRLKTGINRQMLEVMIKAQVECYTRLHIILI
jgi:hypothetical protein